MKKNEIIRRNIENFQDRENKKIYNISLLKYRISLLAELALLLKKTTNKKPYKKLLLRTKEIHDKLPFAGTIYTHLYVGKGYINISISKNELTFFENKFINELAFNEFFHGEYISLIENRQFEEAYKKASDAFRVVRNFE